MHAGHDKVKCSYGFCSATQHRRCSGLMVIGLNSGLNGLGSSPGWGTMLCSWAKHFTLEVPLSTQVYKWVLTNSLLVVTLQWTSIPSGGGGGGGGRKTPSRFLLWKLG